MNDELKTQLRENARRRKEVLEDAKRSWQRLIVASGFRESFDALAEVDTAELDAATREHKKSIAAAKELRLEYERLKSET